MASASLSIAAGQSAVFRGTLRSALLFTLAVCVSPTAWCRTTIDCGASIAVIDSVTGELVASRRFPSMGVPGGGGIQVRCADRDMSVHFGECHLKEGQVVSEGTIAWERGDLLIPTTAFLAIPDLSTVTASHPFFTCPEIAKSTSVRCEASDVRKDGKLLDGLGCRANGNETLNANARFPLGLSPVGPSMDIETYQSGDTVLAATNFYGLFALEKSSGRLLWRFRYHAIYSPPKVVPHGRYYIVGPVLGGLPLTQAQIAHIESRWDEDAASRSALIAAVRDGEDVPPDLRALVETLEPAAAEKPGELGSEPPACRDCSVRQREKTILVPNPWGVLPHDMDDPISAACGKRFVVRAHSLEEALRACSVAERRYTQLLPELGFAPSKRLGLSLVTVYADRDEFLQKTEAPAWSAGLTEKTGIYVTSRYDLDWGLTHEMVHMLLEENLKSDVKNFHTFRWFEEGLAGAMEPVPAYASAPKRTLETMEELRLTPISFEAMISGSLVEMDARSHNRWQTQATSVVRFIRDQCGMSTVRRLLKAAGANQPLEAALAGVCSGQWRTFLELEEDWKAAIQAEHKRIP